MSAADETVLKIISLRQLEQCRDYRLPLDTFLEQVKQLSPCCLTPAEFQSLVGRMERDGWIVGIVPPVGGKPRYSITDKGKAVLAEA